MRIREEIDRLDKTRQILRENRMGLDEKSKRKEMLESHQ